ncbi:hypothetical protein ACQKJC_11650 [Priestia koreensis]|uniref:hypothetical protein n=1 Tax=Priestia koreensis TaxID=284581 RepID=UPI003D054FDF
MEEISFTQAQLDEAIQNAKKEWETEVLSPIQIERDELLQHKPVELTEEQKHIQQGKDDNWKKEVSLTLRENKLESFESIVNVTNDDELKEVVKQLNQIVNDIKVSTGYVPSDHKQTNAYDQAKQQGNTKNMIKSLFGMN